MWWAQVVETRVRLCIEQEMSKTVKTHEIVASRVKLRNRRQPELKQKEARKTMRKWSLTKSSWWGKEGGLHTSSIATGSAVASG